MSGWQCSSTASSTNEPGPDFADYPMDTVPKKCKCYVALFVVDGNNCIANSGLTVAMSEYPVVSLTADLTEGCSPVTVNFNSTATLSSVSAWNFGNGSAPTGTANPQVTF